MASLDRIPLLVILGAILTFAVGHYAFGQAPVPVDKNAAIAAITALPTLPPATVDPIITALQAGPIYAALEPAVAAGAVILSVAYSCPRPAPWAPNTAYLFGASVSDPAGDVYKLTSIGIGATQSGATAPTWGGATVVDSGYIWTQTLQSGQVFQCSTGTAVVPVVTSQAVGSTKP